MIINKSGIVIRIGVSDLRVMGRATQGVRLITFKGDDAIASIAKVEHEEEEADEAETSESETDVDLNSENQETKSEE